MNEAELGRVLGEAMRVYANNLKDGIGLKPFKAMLDGKPAKVTMTLRHDRLIIAEPIDATIAKVTEEAFPDLPRVEAVEQKPQRKEKKISENRDSKR
mgnify:CR=1 FL=1